MGSFSKAGHDASFRRFRAVWVVLCLLASTRVAWAAEASCLQADVELLSPQPSSADLTSAAFGSTPEGAAALVIAGRDGTLLYSLDLGESFHEPVLEVGGIGEFDLTTRLAFQGKVGVRFQQHDSEFLPAMWLITGGLSVY